MFQAMNDGGQQFSSAAVRLGHLVVLIAPSRETAVAATAALHATTEQIALIHHALAEEQQDIETNLCSGHSGLRASRGQAKCSVIGQCGSLVGYA